MIGLVVALIHEARPLIDFYRLDRLKGSHPFVIYSNSQISIIISGVGRVYSAAATAYLQALSVNAGPMAWLNVGIAGHAHFDRGQGFMAHRIIDQASGLVYYPPQIFPFPSISSDLITVDYPKTSYVDHSGYDMEASGYYKIALRSSTVEWVHCYKVVSDNVHHSIKHITKSTVTRLIVERIEEIKAVLSILMTEIKAYRQLELPDDHLEQIIERWHFTETQKSQLSDLIRRWRALYGKARFPSLEANEHLNAREFLRVLKQQIDAHRCLKYRNKPPH